MNLFMQRLYTKHKYNLAKKFKFFGKFQFFQNRMRITLWIEGEYILSLRYFGERKTIQF